MESTSMKMLGYLLFLINALLVPLHLYMFVMRGWWEALILIPVNLGAALYVWWNYPPPDKSL